MTDASIPKQLAVFQQLADCGTAFSRQVLSMVMGMLAAVFSHTFTTTAGKRAAIAQARYNIYNTFIIMCTQRLAEAEEPHIDVRLDAFKEYNLIIELLDRIRARQIAYFEGLHDCYHAAAERARASAIAEFMSVPESDRFVLAEEAYSKVVEKYKRIYADGCARAEQERVTVAAGYKAAYMRKLGPAEHIGADIEDVRVALFAGLDALSAGLDDMCA